MLAAPLLSGEGIITPAISVLSALEGLNVVTHAFEAVVVPAAALILVALSTIVGFLVVNGLPMLRNSVPAHLCFGLGADALVTTETVHLAATAFDDDAPGFVPEGPESVV